MGWWGRWNWQFKIAYFIGGRQEEKLQEKREEKNP